MTLRPFVYLLALLLGSTLVGCDIVGLGDDDEEIPELSILDPDAVTELRDSDFDVAVAAPRHDQALVASTGDGDNLDRVVYVDENQNTATVFVGDNGLPELAVIDEKILIFSNYTDETFDIAAITPDGESLIERDVELPEAANELLGGADLSLKRLDNAALKAKSEFWANFARGASFVMDTALCGGAIAAAKPTFGATVPMAVSSCGSALLTGAAAVSGSDAVKATAAGWDFSWCKAGEASACLALGLEVAAEGLENSENTLGSV